MKKLWIRAGVSLEITDEEEKILLSQGKEEGTKVLRNIVSEGRFSLDGESYIPEPSVRDFNETNGTHYQVQEYDWDV